MPKIVTHLAPRHLDDWLGVSLLLYRHPESEVELVHPQKVPQAYLEDPEVFLVDVGASYDPALNNYDHHQDENLPSSVALIIKHFFPDLENNSNVFVVDVIDRFGFAEAQRRNLVVPSREVDELRKVLLKVPFSPSVGEAVYQVIRDKKELDFDGFVKALYETVKEKAKDLLLKAEEEVKREEQRYQDLTSQVEFLKKSELKVAVSKSSLSPYHGRFFAETKAHVLIERNSMNASQTSVIVNTEVPNAKEVIVYVDRQLARLNKEVTFRHPSGFLRVVNEPVEVFQSSIDLLFSQEPREPQEKLNFYLKV